MALEEFTGATREGLSSHGTRRRPWISCSMQSEEPFYIFSFVKVIKTQDRSVMRSNHTLILYLTLFVGVENIETFSSCKRPVTHVHKSNISGGI